jgi:hypothetical protein
VRRALREIERAVRRGAAHHVVGGHPCDARDVTGCCFKSRALNTRDDTGAVVWRAVRRCSGSAIMRELTTSSTVIGSEEGGVARGVRVERRPRPKSSVSRRTQHITPGQGRSAERTGQTVRAQRADRRRARPSGPWAAAGPGCATSTRRHVAMPVATAIAAATGRRQRHRSQSHPNTAVLERPGCGRSSPFNPHRASHLEDGMTSPPQACIVSAWWIASSAVSSPSDRCCGRTRLFNAGIGAIADDGGPPSCCLRLQTRLRRHVQGAQFPCRNI